MNDDDQRRITTCFQRDRLFSTNLGVNPEESVHSFIVRGPVSCEQDPHGTRRTYFIPDDDHEGKACITSF